MGPAETAEAFVRNADAALHNGMAPLHDRLLQALCASERSKLEAIAERMLAQLPEGVVLEPAMLITRVDLPLGSSLSGARVLQSQGDEARVELKFKGAEGERTGTVRMVREPEGWKLCLGGGDA